MTANRAVITERPVMTTLAHPTRLGLLSYLAADGPATASQAARFVGTTPSNCSYHLRVLAKYGLVSEVETSNGRERPWRANITGLVMPDSSFEPHAEGREEAAAWLAISVQRDQQMQRDYLSRRDEVLPSWREADQHATYTLRLVPEELTALARRLDELIRPYLAPTRPDAPPDAELVHLGLHAFVTAPPGQPR